MGCLSQVSPLQKFPTAHFTTFHPQSCLGRIPVQSLFWEDPQEKEMATHSTILAWGIACIEAPGRLQSMGLQQSET